MVMLSPCGVPMSGCTAGYRQLSDMCIALPMQRLQGELFLFMDLCSRMFSTLRL